MTDKLVVLNTCPSAEEAEKVARHLVKSGLAACVNILPKARSIYRWKDNIEDSEEHVLLIKTRRSMFDQLRKELESVHSYEVPEVIAIEIADGSPAYLAWLEQEIKPE